MGWIVSLFNLGKTAFDGYTEIKKAKIEREVKALTHEANWEAVQADASKGSWKDEWLTLLISIPLILAFFPSMHEVVLQGFKSLEEMPDWYQVVVGGVFAASFGIKSLKNAFNK